jgi:hypothetical protein
MAKTRAHRRRPPFVRGCGLGGSQIWRPGYVWTAVLTSSLWVHEVHREEHHHDNDDEYRVVLPADGLECDWVDESVEEDGDDCRYIRDRQTARAQAVRPDLARIGNYEGSARRTVSRARPHVEEV